jgi:hypothetical protein
METLYVWLVIIWQSSRTEKPGIVEFWNKKGNLQKKPSEQVLVECVLFRKSISFSLFRRKSRVNRLGANFKAKKKTKTNYHPYIKPLSLLSWLRKKSFGKVLVVFLFGSHLKNVFHPYTFNNFQ